MGFNSVQFVTLKNISIIKSCWWYQKKRSVPPLCWGTSHTDPILKSGVKTLQTTRNRPAVCALVEDFPAPVSSAACFSFCLQPFLQKKASRLVVIMNRTCVLCVVSVRLRKIKRGTKSFQCVYQAGLYSTRLSGPVSKLISFLRVETVFTAVPQLL